MPVLLYFLIKIVIIKKDSHLSHLNTNRKPFAYYQIMPALVSSHSSFDTRSLCAVLSNKQW